MLSERGLAANRANALKSTGPRTARGRARSSRNARRHGLTTRPSSPYVAAYFREITRGEEGLGDGAHSGARTRAAWTLALAEARVARARDVIDVERERLSELETRKGAGEVALRRLDLLLEVLPPMADPEPDRGATREALNSFTGRRLELRRRLRTLDRYLREAEAGRRRALRVWLESGDEADFPETKPNAC